jgi:hypothetical protein
MTYAVQISTDLVNWTGVTNILNSTGVFDYTDATGGSPKKFYRIELRL